MSNCILIGGSLNDAQLARALAAHHQRITVAPALTIGMLEEAKAELSAPQIRDANIIANTTSDYCLPLSQPAKRPSGQPFYTQVAKQRRKRN